MMGDRRRVKDSCGFELGKTMGNLEEDETAQSSLRSFAKIPRLS